MSIRRLVLVFGLLLAACGGNGDDSHAPDMQSCGINDDMLGNDMLQPGEGQACTTDGDCPPLHVSGPSDPLAGRFFLCSYPIADGCSAVGHCHLMHVPTCGVVSEACGCNGQPVPNSSCFYEPGLAGGPVGPGTFPQDCPGDGGL